MGRTLQVIAQNQGWLLTVREPLDASPVYGFDSRLRSPVSAALLAHRVFLDGPLRLGYR